MITVVLWKIPELVLFDNLEGWNGEGGGWGAQEGGDTSMPVAGHVDLWQKKITMLSSNYPPITLINFLKSHSRFASMDLAS